MKFYIESLDKPPYTAALRTSTTAVPYHGPKLDTDGRGHRSNALRAGGCKQTNLISIAILGGKHLYMLIG